MMKRFLALGAVLVSTLAFDLEAKPKSRVNVAVQTRAFKKRGKIRVNSRVRSVTLSGRFRPSAVAGVVAKATKNAVRHARNTAKVLLKAPVAICRGGVCMLSNHQKSQ